MSKLTIALASILAQIHWPPAHKPFHEAVVEEVDEVKERVAALEAKFAAVFPTPPAAPVYISEPVDFPVAAMPSEPAEAGADVLDTATGFTSDAGLTDSTTTDATPAAADQPADVSAPAAPVPDPAAQAINPTPPNLLADQPDPAAAGPDTTTTDQAAS